MDENIRIRDIAEMAGVSVGTVDRVLHNRPNVSPSAMAKVQAVLKQIDYKPNKYARARANIKKYIDYCIIPILESETYWEEIEEGARAASIFRREFHVHVKILHYTRFDADDFNRVCQECLAAEPQGVVLVPSLKNETSRFADALHQQDIPMILLDSYVPELKPLSFYGQDSYCSGYFAAKILMLVAAQERGVMLMRRTNNGEVVSVQQKNRENGIKN